MKSIGLLLKSIEIWEWYYMTLHISQCLRMALVENRYEYIQ